MKHSGRTIREAPALEASRTRERARARLAVLSAPEGGEGSEMEEVVMWKWRGRACCELYEGKFQRFLEEVCHCHWNLKLSNCTTFGLGEYRSYGILSCSDFLTILIRDLVEFKFEIKYSNKRVNP